MTLTHEPDTAGSLAALSPELEALRRRYSDEAMASIPKLLILIDRNRYSPTYGCFDRSYWHYRTMDFPCGMSQEFCLPLALVWRYPFADNTYYQVPRIRELALAAVDFARTSAHPDGSCDDYFPYEQALGALVFSLYACTETCLILGEKSPENLEFFARRGDWLLHHNESGQLANHQAFAALALHNTYDITGEERFRQGRDRYLETVREWQSDEGWFQEYEGADPGYHSCSIAFLGKLLKKSKEPELTEKLLKLLRPAVDFAWYFMHPDGSYAGEYGSRNTYHFYPHGFEVMAPHSEKAGQIADQFLKLALPNRRRYFNDDDRMLAHYVYDWLQSCIDFCPSRPPEPLNARPNFTMQFPKAKMLVHKTDDYYAVLSLLKGGVLKVTDEEGPVYSDTGLIGRLDDGRVVVSHLVGDYKTLMESKSAGETVARAEGKLHERRTKLPSPFKLIIFRCLNLTFGRFASNLLRKILQKILITGKPETELRFSRQFKFAADRIEIVDQINRPDGAPTFTSLHIGSDATSIYVANSNVYQESVLLPWQDLGHKIDELNSSGSMVHHHSVVPAADAPKP